MKLPLQRKIMQARPGQVWVLYAIALPVILAFAGLTIDLGNAYFTKQTLDKAIDAAALAAMQNLNLGQAQATTIAQNAFNANFGSNPPTVTIAFTTDANRNKLVNVTATTTVNTYFLGVLSGSKTMNIADSAQATRNPLVMSLVLDRSGSMSLNGGGAALPPAVVGTGGSNTGFIGHFDDQVDYVADISFSTVDNVDVALTQPFISRINSAVEGMSYSGGTNAYAGMTDALAQINAAPIAGPNVRKVVVFFTDGYANINSDKLLCSVAKGATAQPMLYGGCDPGDYGLNYCAGLWMFTPSGTITTCPNLGVTDTTGRTCKAGSSFPVQLPSGQNALCPTVTTGQTNVAADADYRTVQLSKSMRAQNILVYSIGLGSAINQPFLYQIANDKNSATYDPSQPVGKTVFAPTAADLNSVFNLIAADVLLRLTQ